MKFRVLGSAGAELPGYNSPAFLIDGGLLLDAGTIGSYLTEREQWKIKNILLTHSHLDHIKAIPFLADNIVMKKKKHSFTLYGIQETLTALRQNLLNDMIWPDFTRISVSLSPVVKLRPITAEKAFRVNSYKVTAYTMDHSVPAVGYSVSDKQGRTLIYTGDTGPSFDIWDKSSRADAVIIEVSLPNSMETLARKTGHFTPALLGRELDKMKNFPERIFITHLKPQYRKQIGKEINGIKRKRQIDIRILKDGEVYKV
jgi:ribonuclease BN (tRNA processing enzyme)